VQQQSAANQQAVACWPCRKQRGTAIQDKRGWLCRETCIVSTWCRLESIGMERQCAVAAVSAPTGFHADAMDIPVCCACCCISLQKVVQSSPSRESYWNSILLQRCNPPKHKMSRVVRHKAESSQSNAAGACCPIGFALNTELSVPQPVRRTHAQKVTKCHTSDPAAPSAKEPRVLDPRCLTGYRAGAMAVCCALPQHTAQSEL
jgi:hypothetical protein